MRAYALQGEGDGRSHKFHSRHPSDGARWLPAGYLPSCGELFLHARVKRMQTRVQVLSVAMLLAGAVTLHAQPTLRPAPSGRATTAVTLTYPRDSAPAGATPVSITIDYGQPHLRGRALHTDSLVPYDKPWRTGANNATTLTTGVDLLVGGKAVPKGTYVIWTLPTRTGWQLSLQRSAAPGSMQAAMTFDAASEVARIDLVRHAVATPLESLTMWLIPSTAPGKARGTLRIGWGSTLLSTDWIVQ